MLQTLKPFYSDADGWCCWCPYCDTIIQLTQDEIAAYEATGFVYIECFGCGNSFYLEDNGN